jgi:hypothetical protein
MKIRWYALLALLIIGAAWTYMIMTGVHVVANQP